MGFVRYTISPTLAMLLLSVGAPRPGSAQSSTVLASATVPNNKSVPALERPARLAIRDVPLLYALIRLHETSGVPVSFSPSLLPREQIVSCACQAVTVSRALDLLLNKTGLTYRELDGHVLVYPVVQSDIQIDRPHLDLVQPRYASISRLPEPRTVLQEGQEGTVTGSVVEVGSLRPLAGVQVHIPGTSVGTLTNAAGRYILENVPEGRVTIRAQMIGFAVAETTVSVSPGGTATVNFELREEALRLDEVVVTGTAGGVQRRAVGNVVARVDVDQIMAGQAGAISTFEDALRGEVAGVQFLPAPGQPGAGAKIRIRGGASASLSGNPLIYVDGIRMSADMPVSSRYGSVSALNDLDPRDIASIEVIKGPAAATLYGTEASNGVIQIITKRGSQGAPSFTASVELGAAWLPQEYLRTVYAPFKCDPPCSSIEELSAVNIVEAEAERGNQVFKKGLTQSYNFSVQGGAETVSYYASLNHNDQQGVLSWKADQRSSVRANLTLTPSDEFTLRFSGQYNEGENWGSSDGFWAANIDWGGNPISYFQDPEGLYRGWTNPPEEYYRNATPQTLHMQRSLWSLEAHWQPTEWLTHRLVTGRDIQDLRDVSETIKNNPASATMGGCAEIGCRSVETTHQTTTTVDFSGTVSLPFGDQLTTATSYGLQYYNKAINTVEAEGEDFATAGLRTVSSAAITEGSEGFLENATLGFYVQERLGWENRIFITGAVRMDDNSSFGRNFDAAVYPKASATWVIAEEPFFDIDWVSQLRLRAAWGKAGQQPDAFAAAELFRPETGPGQAPILLPASRGNPDLGPEIGEELELGFDASFLGDRLSLSYTRYQRTTTDAIVARTVPASIGIPGSSPEGATQLVNIGEVKGWGNEVSLGFNALTEDPLRWDINLSFSTQMSDVTDLGSTELIAVGRSRAHVVGYPLAHLSARRVIQAEFVSGDRGPVTNVMCDGGRGPGNHMKGGPPVPCDEAGEVYWGPTTPRWIANVNSTVTVFQDWTVSATVASQGGHWMSSEYLTSQHQSYSNSPLAFLRDNALAVAQLNIDRVPISFHKAGFVKLRELSVSYEVPESVVSRVGLSRARVSVGGRNLWRIYTRGLCPPLEPRTCATDPEVNRPEYNFPGESSGSIPPLQSFTASVRVGF